MDALTFGSNILLRRLTFSEARKMPVQEIHLDKVLEGMDMSKEEFIDFCIMLGCDYTGTIKGIGPKRAVDLIKNHKTLEKIVENIDSKKYAVPEDWNYQQARQLFIEPEVADSEEIDVSETLIIKQGIILKIYSLVFVYLLVFTDSIIPVFNKIIIKYDT